MPFNNNQQNSKPTTTTYTPIDFSNPQSKIMPSKINLKYFNKLMCIAISKATGQNGQYTSYDYNNSKEIYLSFTKAKILHDLIVDKLMVDDKIENVCIETNKGLLKISKGKEYKSDTPVISIITASDGSRMEEAIYQTKGDFYTGAYNYTSPGKFTTYTASTMELDTLVMILEQYYLASSYAIPAAIAEATMYKRESQYKLIKAIADKVGVQQQNDGFSNRSSFLSGGGNNEINNIDDFDSNINDSIIPKEYETSTFDEIAKELE